MSVLKGVPLHRYPPHVDTSWEDQAACLGHNPEMWFTPRLYPAALLICATCPVTEQCKRARHGADGVWGGRVYGGDRRLAPSLRDYVAVLHGTVTAARRHQRRGEPCCQLCLDAQKGRPRKAQT